MSRDRVLALLWPERDDEHARHALAQLVYELRQDLGRDVIAGNGEELSLSSRAVMSDVAEFDRAIDARDFERAAALYVGPFLDGFHVGDAPEFERWADEQRARHAALHLRALDALAAAASQRGDHAAVVTHTGRAAAADPLSARRAMAFMQALASAGDCAAAIRHAEVHAVYVKSELDVDADAAVARFAERLASEARSPATRQIPLRSPVHAALDFVVPPERTVQRALASSSAFRAIATLALIVLGALALGFRLRGTAAPRFAVLAEIESTDTVLALAVKEALGAELERTPAISLLSDAAVQESLRLLELHPGEPLTAGIADDVAVRRGTPLVVTGAVTPVGSGAQIVLRLVDASTARTIVSVSQWARTADDILPAVAKLAADLRARMTATTPGTPPLPAVTTSSIEALRNYALARAALSRLDRQAAITYGEAALAHDSTFALAHYLVGDLLWYVDKERHAEMHLKRAYELRDRLPPRERLTVEARYTQLVLDRPDSAITFWRELRAAYPAEVLGYEGSVWADLAVGSYDDAAAAADSALRLDSSAAPQVRNRMIALLALRDTAAALQLTRHAGAAWPDLEQQALLAEYEGRGDLRGFTHVLDSIAPPVVNGAPNPGMAPTRQALLLSARRVSDARAYADLVSAHMPAQFAMRSELWQARGELAWGGSRQNAERLLYRAIATLDSSDLSPPATARLAELAAGVAAAARDESAIRDLRRIVLARDAGRGLPSHRLAELTLDAAARYARADYRAAVPLLDRTRTGRFYGRSGATLALLEADALARAGDGARADSLYRAVATPGATQDDGETWMVLQAIATNSIRR